MKKFLLKLTYPFDYVIGYVLTKPTDEKMYRYHKYMYTKYGSMYMSESEWKATKAFYEN